MTKTASPDRVRAASRQRLRVDEGLGVRVLGTFQFRAGEEPIPAVAGGTKRLLAFLCLGGRVVTRTTVAGTLWPESTDAHAHASLRSALSRLTCITREAIAVTPVDLCIAEGVTVDLRDSRALARRFLDPNESPSENDLSPAAVAALSADLLADWYDDWVMLEAEEWRQLRVHALEALSGELTKRRRFGEAAGAALAAVKVEPLRESARAAIIRVHLAEDNRSEAMREFARYAALLQVELGIQPTPRLRELVGDVRFP